MLRIKKTTKVIFLDFDGVIVTRTTRYRYPSIRPLKHIQDIVDKTGAVVVVSSTWRINRSLQTLRSLLNPPGFMIPVIDVTPRLMSRERGDEITQWLNENEGVEEYIILDDDSDMGIHIDRLVRTHTYKGIKRREKERAIQLLGKKVTSFVDDDNELKNELPKEIEKLNIENPEAIVELLNRFECDYHYLSDVKHSLNLGVVEKQDDDFEEHIARRRYRVECSCGAAGPCRNTISEAVRMWVF